MKAFVLLFFITLPTFFTSNPPAEERWFFKEAFAKKLKADFEANRASLETGDRVSIPTEVVDIIRDNVVIFFAMDNKSRGSYMRRVIRSCKRHHGMTGLEAQKFMAFYPSLECRNQ